MRRGTLAFAALFVAACLAAAGGKATEKRQPRVGFVIGAGVVPTKRTLDGQMFAGFLKAEKELPIRGRVVYVPPTQDPSGAMTTLAREKYDLVIVALPRIDVAYIVARKFPGVRFFLIDIPPQSERPPHEPKNVQGSMYRAEEAGYLAGYLAALVEGRTPGKHAISAVGGIAFVGVSRWTVGYKAGARKADPSITVQTGYSRDFANPAKCRRVALRQIAQGSGVVFNVAGACGLGALGAAKDEGVWGVGVDVDQAYLGPHMLTSAVLKLDTGVFATVQRFVRGRLPRGQDPVFDLHNGGVGLGRISPKVAPSLLRRLEAVRRGIVAGRIQVPRAT
jgi:basic membrane protein A and related proteins